MLRGGLEVGFNQKHFDVVKKICKEECPATCAKGVGGLFLRMGHFLV